MAKVVLIDMPWLGQIVRRIPSLLRLQGPLAGDRTAQMLHALLLLIGGWTAVASISTLPLAPLAFHRIFDVLVLEVSLATALVVLRLGHFRRASIVHLAGIWIWATLIFAFYGGVHSTGMVLYVSLPVSAAWLLGYRAALWTAGWCLLSALVFAVWQTMEVSLPTVLGTPLGKWAVLVQATLINAIPVGQIIGRLRETLEELQQHQQHLELLVDQRTSELAERKRIVEALRESEERFRRVFEEGPLGLALVAKDYRFVKVNRALCQMVGYSETELSKKSFVDITYPDDVQTDIDHTERLFRREVPFYQLRKRYVKKNSDIIWINLTASVIRDQEGEVMYGLAMIEDITELKRAQEIENRLSSDLEASRDEIRALAASLMRAQEDERRRVSRELHDHICHQLGSLAREISNIAAGPLPSENVRAKLEEIRARVVKTSQETQQIAHQMHTSVLDDLGLVASLKDLCSEFSEQYPDIAMDFENRDLPASISREVSTCLYRVAEESLQNIAKHSRAKNVSVRLGFKKGAVLLTIQDDGAGFDVKAVKGIRWARTDQHEGTRAFDKWKASDHGTAGPRHSNCA